MTVEKDREWFHTQIGMLQQEIDRIQSGSARAVSMSLGQPLTELETCTRAVEELDTLRFRRRGVQLFPAAL